MAVQGLVGSGLVCVNIQTGAAYLAALKACKQSSLINVGAAAGVDNGYAVLHLGDGLGIDEGAAVYGGGMYGDEVGFGKQLVKLYVGEKLVYYRKWIRLPSWNK